MLALLATSQALSVVTERDERYVPPNNGRNRMTRFADPSYSTLVERNPDPKKGGLLALLGAAAAAGAAKKGAGGAAGGATPATPSTAPGASSAASTSPQTSDAAARRARKQRALARKRAVPKPAARH